MKPRNRGAGSRLEHGGTQLRNRTLAKRRKKVVLKSGSRDRIVALSQTQTRGQRRKKVLHLKNKCVVSKRSLSGKLNSLPTSSEKKTDEWLDSLNCKNSQPEDDQTLKASLKNTTVMSIHPVEPASSLSGDSDMASTLEASFIDHSVQPEKSSSDDPESIPEESCHLPIDAAAPEVLLYENQTALSDLQEVKQSTEETSKEKYVTPKKLLLKSPISQENQEVVVKMKGVTKCPLTAAKKMKSKRLYCRKEFLKFYLQNSHNGFHRALKKFHDKKLVQSLKHNRAGGVKSNDLEAVDINNSIQRNAPLKIVVKERLSSSGVAQTLCSSTLKTDVATPTSLKMFSGLDLPIHRSNTHNIVTCKVPYESSPEKEGPHNGTSMTNESKVSNASNRDVCYIFALLDREKEETLFKCSPHVKSSKVLQQIASVIDSISTDEDLLLSKKIYIPDGDECSNRRTDQSTSPISFPVRPNDEDCQFPPPVEDGPNMSEEENSDDSGLQSDMERKNRLMNATTKVIISKALLSFTSELKVLTDVSIRLLGWSSGAIKADLDSDSFEDEFEGFLCHCHDKVSILIECLHELDLRQILNIDEVELHRFWLLHDAVRCMLQAYRYVQSPSATDHLSQKLLSLMMTCSKTMLPRVSISLDRWTSLMTMISGISTKLCEARLLSNACWCYQHFESLRKGRPCRVCDLRSFFKEVCKTEPDQNRLNVKSSTAFVAKTAIEQLFPRFCWFLNEVEGLSKEEFMTAFRKHSVVKFSCNAQSGLYPCDVHLSVIACSCFASSTSLDSHSQQAEEKTSNEGETNNDMDNVHKALNESSDQQIVPLCVEAEEENSPATQKSLVEKSSFGDGQKTGSSSTCKVSKVIEVSLESSESSIASEETIDISKNGNKPQESNCEVVLLNEGSSDDFSLHLEESSNPDPQSSNASQLGHHGSEDGTAVMDSTDTADPSCSMYTNHSGSPLCGQVPLPGRKVRNQDGSDISVSLSSNSELNYSNCTFEVARSNLKNSLLGNESDSILSVADSQSLVLEPSTDEAELMRDVSIGDDDVFESSSCVKEHSSICPQMDSDSSSMDEVHSSQGNEDHSTKRLKSPPPFNVETTPEDTDSSIEVSTSSGRVVPCGVSSTQGKDVEVKTSVPLIDIKGSVDSADARRTDQVQRMKEDCRRRVLQALRSRKVMVSPPPEANHSNQSNILTRNQHSSTESSEKKSTTKENENVPKQSVSETVFQLRKRVTDQQGGPTDGKKIHSDEPSIKKRIDKKVTFNDILQFKEITDSPILGYGRTKRMPENFSPNVLKEKIECLLHSMYDTSDPQNVETIQENSHDEGPSTKSTNARNDKETKDDVADVGSACVEKDLRKSRKRKLSLRCSKVDPLQEIEKKVTRATRSNTFSNAVSDKLKHFCMLDDKFRNTFDPQRNEDTQPSSAQQKSESRIKRTMTDVEEDSSDKLDKKSISSKKAKNLSTLEPRMPDVIGVQRKMTEQTPKIIKSCLKKPIKTQTETNVSSNMNPIQGKKDMLLVNAGEQESQEVPLPTHPKLDSDSAIVPEQDSSGTRCRKVTRRLIKEIKKQIAWKESKYLTDQEKVSLKSNIDDDEIAVGEKSKQKKVELRKEHTKDSVQTEDVEDKSNATNKRKRSKRSKSNSVNDDQGSSKNGQGCFKARDPNMSDSEWKAYISGLEGWMLDK